jgi:hypothetical protein
MRIHIKVLTAETTLACICFLLICVSSSRAQGEFRIHDEIRLKSTRQVGLEMEQTRIPDLIAILQENPTPTRFLMETTLLSVAQLGATKALPAINALAQSDKNQNSKVLVNPNIVHAAIAARARLIAEADSGPDDGSLTQAQAKLNIFYSELGETPADLNAALLTYNKEAAKPNGADVAPSYPTELYAVRMLADMAYRSAFKGFTKLPGMAEVDFSQDPRSALKVRLAPLSDSERAAWLVEDLSHKTALTETEDAEIQLAGELGTLASAAAASKLQEMERDHAEYGRAAFNALFGALTVSGGSQKMLLKHFEKDPNPFIAEYAQNGGANNFIAGY